MAGAGTLDTELQAGTIVDGRVTHIAKFGAFVALPGNRSGMVHISEVANAYVREVTDYVHEGDAVRVMILAVAPDGKISLSLKRALPVQPEAQPRREGGRTQQCSPPIRFGRSEDSFSGTERRAPAEYHSRRRGSDSFEDMMSHFKKESDEKMSDLKKVIEPKRGGGGRKYGK